MRVGLNFTLMGTLINVDERLNILRTHAPEDQRAMIEHLKLAP